MGHVHIRPRRRGERPNGYPNDVLAPDGIAEYGWRLVRKGGVVKFVGSDWQDDALLPFVGQYVVVKVGDVHCCDVDVLKQYPGGGSWFNEFICNISVGREMLTTPPPGYEYDEDEEVLW